MSLPTPAQVADTRRICLRARSFGIGLREAPMTYGSRWEWLLPTGKIVAGQHIVTDRRTALVESIDRLVLHFPAVADS